jgi:hypothetical protein
MSFFVHTYIATLLRTTKYLKKQSCEFSYTQVYLIFGNFGRELRRDADESIAYYNV